MATEQYELALIEHVHAGEVISIRAHDGYVNATAMCKAAGKEFKHYRENKTTKAFAEELSSEVGIPTSELIQVLSGGFPSAQGTWVHPQVAIHLAQWCSPKFAVRVSRWVYEWMSGRPPEAPVWQLFQDRLSLVHDSVPEGYFGIFKESADVYATMIIGGVNLGTQIILDISVGQHWARYWKMQSLADQFGPAGRYPHNYPGSFPQALSNPQWATCYPEEALPTFRRWMRNVYMPSHLPEYLRSQVKQNKLTTMTATTAIGVIELHKSRRAIAQLR